MNTQRFQELKSLLTQGKDFGKVLTFFFDHIGEAPELPAVSRRVERPIVETAAQAAVQEMTGQAGLTEFLLLSVDPHHFLHGGFLVKGRVGTVFYFEDVQMGLVCVADGSGHTPMARFRTLALPSWEHAN